MAMHALVEFHMLGLANFKYSIYCVILIPNISFSCVYAPGNGILKSFYVCSNISSYFKICLSALKRSMILLLPLNNNKLLFT